MLNYSPTTIRLAGLPWITRHRRLPHGRLRRDRDPQRGLSKLRQIPPGSMATKAERLAVCIMKLWSDAEPLNLISREFHGDLSGVPPYYLDPTRAARKAV
jgi:hypothetical protein